MSFLQKHLDYFLLFAKVIPIITINYTFELHLFGHSMGGLIALRTAIKFSHLPLNSISVSAPLLKLAQRVPALKKMAGQMLSHFWGSIQMASEVDPKVLSHDQDVVSAYQSDRLVHQKITPSLYFSMERVMAQTVRSSEDVAYPVQFLIPMADQLVDSDTTLKFYSGLKWKNKNLKTYPGFFHEIHNEIGKEQVFGDLISWIEAHKS